MTGSAAKSYTRFSWWHRIDHIMLVVSFTVLVVTGIPQKFISQPWAEGLIRLMGGIELTRQFHHIAAAAMLANGVYHLALVGYRIFVRRVRWTMLPSLKDVTDALVAFARNLGLRKAPPAMGRYNFAEKAEYWALIWGTVAMGLTGFILLNPIFTTRYLPGVVVPAAKAMHGLEAILAALAIVIWHFYNLHLKMFNLSMFTGRMSEHEMAEEHAAELAEIHAGQGDPEVPPAVLRQRRTIYYPVAGVLSVALLFGMYRMFTFENTSSTITTVPRREQVSAYVPLTPTPWPTARPSPTMATVQAVWEGNVSLILTRRCGSCHGAAGGLKLTTLDGILKGGKSGPAVAPGDAAGSLIVQMMDKPHAVNLNEKELATVEEWIAAGAPAR